LPGPIERAARRVYGAIPPTWRYGQAYRKMADFLAISQTWSESRLREYQSGKLRELLVHAYRDVPLYRRIFTAASYDPAKFGGLSDLKQLPFLTREVVRQNTEDLIADNYPKSKLQHVTTSGSTGNPLGFYFEHGATDAIERAFIHALWRRVGYGPGDRCAIFRGRILRTAGNGSYWEYDPVERNLYFSTYHMTDDVLWSYVERIRHFKPFYICGYPSAILALANFMLREKIAQFQTVRAVLCGSETLFPGLRMILKDAFGSRVFSWYGHSERAALAGECERGEQYHIFTEYGIVELARPDGSIIECPGESGEIVATGFINPIFPLIRYRTGDIAVYSDKKCSCGRAYPLLSRVEGRIQEFIVTKDGRKINLTSFGAAHHFKAYARMRQMQIIQDKAGAIQVRIVRGPEYSQADETEIRDTMLRSVSSSIDIAFDYVKDIPRSPNGKHKFLIQRLPVGQGVGNI